jgi:hypothetical protein
MKRSSKTKRHIFTVAVKMDKHCSRALALRNVRDELRGQNFYPVQYEDHEPGEFWIRSIRLAPKKAVQR